MNERENEIEKGMKEWKKNMREGENEMKEGRNEWNEKYEKGMNCIQYEFQDEKIQSKSNL